MMHHANQIAFDDIIYRAKAIGGSDLMKLPDSSSDKYAVVIERTKFLKNFYLYCQQENPSQNSKAKTWFEWVKSTNY